MGTRLLNVLPRNILRHDIGHDWGVAYSHIKAFGLFPFPHQIKICIEDLQDQHMLGYSVCQFIFSKQKNPHLSIQNYMYILGHG